MILITGGAGSIGSNLIKKLVARNERVTVFDSSEYGLFKLKSELGTNRVNYVLGNLSDKDAIKQILHVLNLGDNVIHLASLKNIVITEQNPRATIYSNIIGTLNLVEAILEKLPILKFLTISSDKSVEFSNIYGASKFLQEKLTLWAGGSVIRLCNVKETRGNVFETWAKQKAEGKPLTITDPRMKRYFITVDQATDYILHAFDTMRGKEIFVPEVEPKNMMDLAKSISNDIKIIGIREGEKIEEKMMTDEEREKALGPTNDLWVIK